MFNVVKIVLYFEGGWYIAAVNENCIDACTSQNLECSEEQFYQQNSDVDTSSEVLSMIRNLGGTISASSCSHNYGQESDVPNYTSYLNDCFYSNSSRSLSTFSCSRLPAPTSNNKQRLCWCHTAGNLKYLCTQ